MPYRILQQMAQILGTFKTVLDKAEAYANEQGIPHETLTQGRLAPDMFTLVRQIQSATDTAKFAAARLSGQTAPVFEDTEVTFDELRARLQKAVDYLNGLGPGDFAHAAERPVTLPFARDMHILGEDYLHQFAVPNFYFHLVTAYDILRHHGVPIGKRDYIGMLNMRPGAA